MTDSLAHRGPDDEGHFLSSAGPWALGLGHRRLSIIDLSLGHQPMGNEDGSIQIVFNGEVYNFKNLRAELIAAGHRFASHSDTEVIVHAYEQWGMGCVSRLRGMFAFALWDSGNGRLVLARDRFGKKPLYFRWSSPDLIFASEAKAILAWPGVRPEVDHAAVWDYLAYRYVPAPATLFRGIRKLMPGTVAVWQDGRLAEARYAWPPDREPLPRATRVPSPEVAVAGFMDKLDEAVRLRMVADVPFGAFLSGGIDSSAVVALMSRHATKDVRTFSVGFREARYSELRYAREVAQAFRTQHEELLIDSGHIMDQLPTLIRFRDAPVSEPSDIPIYLLSKQARQSVKMVLTGEGSDEILGGYPKHVFERYVKPYQWLPRTVRRGLVEPLARALPYSFRRAKTAVINLGIEDFAQRMPRWFGAMDNAERRALVALSAPDAAPLPAQFDTPVGNSALRRVLYFDQSSWLPDNLLERGDRMTMAASIEARMPFLDHELAASVSALPDRFRVRGHETKWILRQGMNALLPASIRNRPKVGFRIPVNEWFQGPMRDYLRGRLTSATSRTRAYYHQPVLEQIVAEHLGGRQNHEKLLWALLTLELWHEEYGL